jgi:hypothetical protein
MSNKYFAQVLTLMNAGALPPDAFPRALKRLTKIELQALYDLIATGAVGTPRERLRALAAKEHATQFLAKFEKLTVTEQSDVLLRIEAGEAIDL